MIDITFFSILFAVKILNKYCHDYNTIAATVLIM
jgi:hypothetical protein